MKQKILMAPILLGLETEADHVNGSPCLIDELFQHEFSFHKIEFVYSSTQSCEGSLETIIIPVTQWSADNVDHNITNSHVKMSFPLY